MTTRIGPGFREGGFRYHVPDRPEFFGDKGKRMKHLLGLRVVMDDGFSGRICLLDRSKRVIEVLPEPAYREAFGR